MPQVSDEEMMLLKELLAEKRLAAQRAKRRDGPDPAHRGVIDPDYVRGSDVREFPKMAYRKLARDPKGYTTRIIESAEEQAAVVKQGWLVATKDIHQLLDGIAHERSGVAEEVAAQ